MILRRVIAHFRKQEWPAIALFLFVAAGALLAARTAAASPVPSDEISPTLLHACDEQAMPFGGYDPAIAAAVADLTAMGVFTEAEFHSVKIGFCALRAVEGPAATISCARDIILLDSGQSANDKRLVRNANLAHEMKHYLQHSAQKAVFGERYCFNDQYAKNKIGMEEEADAFGDEVAALFFAGRSVEIKNECPVPVSIYLEADRPVWAAGGALDFTQVAPHATVVHAERSASKFFRVYAETQTSGGPKRIWGAARSADSRIIAGKSYGLKPVTLSNASRSNGPFRMTLSCPPDAHP